MIRFYALTHADGRLSIMQLLDPAADPEDSIRKQPSPVVSWRQIDRVDIPYDRTFRDAWLDAGKAGIDVDIVRARDIVRDHLRHKRAPLLAALDVDYQRADEAGDGKGKAAIARRKQALRDWTKHPAIEAAKTPAALKAAMESVAGDG